MRWLIFALVLSITPAFAQSKLPITLTLTQDEAQLILNKLGESPWKDVNPLMMKLITQINTQLAPQSASPPPKEAKPNE